MRPADNYISRRFFIGGLTSGAFAVSLNPGLAQDKAKANPFEALSSVLKNARGDEELFSSLRKLYRISPDLVYMNNGGLGPSPSPVIDTMFDHVNELEGVSESGHEKVDKIRQKACGFFNCKKEEVAFTRSTTEGMNIIARGVPLKAGDQVLMSTHEHPGGSMPWLALVKDKGISLKLFEPKSSSDENLDIISSSITKQTRVLLLSHITCTTGNIFNVEEISKICKAKGVISVYDGAQAAGMIPVDFDKIGCDFYATSGHKWLCGPKGSGLLYINNRMLDNWKPTYVGCYSDASHSLEKEELKYIKEAKSSEYGTRNTPGVAALGAAFDFITTIGDRRITARIKALASFVRQGLEKIEAIEILTPSEAASCCGITTFRPKDRKINPWAIANTLKNEHKIRLRPVGENNLMAIRISTHIYNSFDEISRLLDVLNSIFK